MALGLFFNDVALVLSQVDAWVTHATGLTIGFLTGLVEREPWWKVDSDYPDFSKRKRDLIPRLPKPVSDRIAMSLLNVLTHFEEAEEADILDYDEKEPVIERLYREQFRYHSKYVGWATLLILVGFFGARSWIVLDLQILGLMFDACGAFFLALGIVRGRAGLARDSRERVGRLGGGGDGGIHHASLKAEIADTIDGIAGAMLLLIGFTIQTIAILYERAESWLNGDVLFSVVISLSAPFVAGR